MPHININNDTKMYYEISGEGQPLVLIPGYCCDHTTFDPIKAALERHFRIIMLDNLGSGQTQDKPIPLTVESLADAVMDLIQQLDLNTPHVAGHSMGGMMTQVLGKKYGNKLGKLAILNSQNNVLSTTKLSFGAMLRLRQQNASIDALIELVLPWLFSSEYLDNPENIQFQKQLILNAPYPQSVEDQARQYAALEQFDSWSWANQIKNPTLVIGSESDIIASAQQSHDLAEQLPHSVLKLLPGGHVCLIEDGPQLSQILIEFFK